MSNTGTIHIALKINDKGVVRVMQDVGKASADTGQKGRKAFDDMDRSAKSFNGSAKMSTDTLLKMGAGVAVVYAVTAALEKAASVIKQVDKALWDAGTSYDRTVKALEAITGSSAGAAQQIEYLRVVSARYGQNLYDILPAYKNFLAATSKSGMSLQDTRTIFEGATKAIATMGLTSAETHRVLYALQQMVSKGMSGIAEEVNQQMGEVLPGAFGMFADSLGVSQKKLRDMMEQGQLTLNDLVKFGSYMGTEFSGEISEAVAAQNRFNQEWQDLKIKMAGSGFMDSATKALKDFTEVLKDPGVIDGAKAIAATLGKILEFSAKGVKGIGQLLVPPAQRLQEASELYKKGSLGMSWENFTALPYEKQLEAIAKASKVASFAIDDLTQSFGFNGKAASAAVEPTKELIKAQSDLQEEWVKLSKSAEEYDKYEIDKWYEAEAKALGGVTPKLKEVYELMLKKNQAKHEEISLEKAYQDVRDAMADNYDTSWQAELDRFDANDLKDRAEVLKEAGKKSEKEIQEASEKSQKAYEKRMDEQKAASLDFADTVKDHTADIINNYDSMAETVVNIVKRMIADMAATILAQKILIPIGLQVGSALGASWNGVPFSAMQSNTAAANISPTSLLSSGNSLYNSFGIGDFLNSGTGGKIGSSIFGNAAWFGTPYFGAAEYMVPAAYGAAGSTAGGMAGALGTIAPIAAVAAIAIPLLMKAFKKEKDPLVAFHFGYDYPEKITKTLPVNEISEGGTYTDILQERPGSVTSDMGFFTYSQKMGPETNAAVKDYFEKQFAAIDDSLKINFEDVIKQKALESEAGLNPGEIGTGWNPEKYGGLEGALKEANNWVAKSLAAQFVQAYGLDASISPGLFEKLIPEGSDSMFDAFVRFGQLMESTDDAVAKFNRQLEITGNNAEQAFLNMESISAIFTSMDALLDPVTKLNYPLVTIIDQFNLWIDALEAANAGVEDITRAEQKRTQALGAQLSGLSAQNVGQSMLSAITTGTDIDAALNQIIGNSIAGTVSAALTKEVMDDAILPFVDSIGQAFLDSGNNIEAVFQVLPALMAGLDLSGNRAKIESFTEKWQEMFGEMEDLAALETTRDSAAQAYLSALQSELSALETKMNDAKSVYLDLLNDELSVQEALVSALSSSIKSLQSFRSNLWADNAAGPADQRNMLSGRMSELYNTAVSGDAGAIEDLISVSGQYLDVSKKMQTDWISYARDMAKTSTLLFYVESAAQDQLSEAQRQVLHLEGIIAEVSGVSNKLTDIDLARQAYESAKMEFDTSWMHDEVTLLQGILTSSQTLEQLMAAFQKAQSAVGGGGGSGRTNSGSTDSAIEDAYLKANPDVAAAVSAGQFVSGYEHYLMHGQYEGRGLEGYAGQSQEGIYLNTYLDVAAAVQRGEFKSGAEHYLKHGQSENRKFADGGILSGPKSGYPVNATFHGIEAVIPLNSGNIPVRIIDDSRGETTEEIRLLRKEMAAYGDAVVRHTSDIARLIDLWETFGPPAVRETV